jgi:outer membrane lipase/esterase
MASQWMRRGLLALASASALVLAACGSGSIESQLQPTRVVVFGDGFSDVGQTGKRYTVNDNGINVWTQGLAGGFGISLLPVAAGGTAYATLNARVSAKPDAVGNNATPTVAEQIGTFLAGNSITANDLVVVNGGISDIVAEMAQVTAGAQTSEQMIADVRQAGRDLGAQVHRLVAAGATHVVVVGTYDLGVSPWARATGQTALLSEASTRFNTELLVSIVDLGATTLYVDAALLYNLMYNNPALYSLINSADPVCNSVDAGVGIGVGTGQVNSALCTTSTVIDTAYGAYLFADRVYPAPGAHIKFGDYAYSRVRSRW